MISTDQYVNYFPVGMKVGVGIPMHNGETFRDWAIIHDIDEDLVYLQLSRDQLPVAVSLHIGQILELRGGKEDSGYSCRSIIVSEGEEHQILLRLIGEIVTDELREFYRIDAFLPVKCHLPAEQRLRMLENEWIDRRERYLAEELLRKQQRWGGNLAVTGDHTAGPRHNNSAESEHEEPEDDDSPWDTVIPLAANISGGGIRILAHQGFEPDNYVNLEILVPAPHHIVDAVARVVSVKQNNSVVSDRTTFNVSLKFIYINERDRDSIVNYISNIQLKRIRQLRMQYALLGSLDGQEAVPFDRYAKYRQIAYILLLIGFIALITVYMWGYAQNRPKSEIEEMFERGIREYILK